MSTVFGKVPVVSPPVASVPAKAGGEGLVDVTSLFLVGKKTVGKWWEMILTVDHAAIFGVAKGPFEN